jgi:hypothetical protein
MPPERTLGLRGGSCSFDTHRAEAEAVDGDVSADGELAGEAGVDLGHGNVPLVG